MVEGSLHVIARMKARPEESDQLRELLSSLIEPTRAEAGCLRYELLANKEDPTQYTFVEEWVDDAALESHLATDHLQRALGLLPDLLAEDLDLKRYRRIC